MTGFHIDGGYAEYFTVPWDSTAVVPEGLSDEEAAPLMVRTARNVALLTQPAVRRSDGLQRPPPLRRSFRRPRRHLCALVTLAHIQSHTLHAPDAHTHPLKGIGGLGHLGVQFAHHMGFRTVAISNGAQKEQYARKLGADYYIDMSKQDVGAELVRPRRQRY